MDQLHHTKNSQNAALIEIDEGIRLHITWAQKVFQYLVLKTPAEPQFSAKESHLSSSSVRPPTDSQVGDISEWQ